MTDYETLHYDKDKLRQACKETHTDTNKLISMSAVVPTMFAVIEV